MRILLIIIDSIPSISLKDWMDAYEKRINRYCHFEIHTISVPKNVRYKSIEEQKDEEARLIEKYLKDSDYVIILDEHGKEFSSMEFSHWIQKKQQMSFKRLVFIIGGPYGFSDTIKNTYPEKISLSKMTFSHEIVRLIFLEQLYRAFTIINGQKYHHE